MKEAYKVDLDGLFIEPTLVSDFTIGIFKRFDPEENLIGYTIAYKMPDGLYEPRWDFKNEVWVDDKQTDKAVELDEIKNRLTSKINIDCQNSILKGFQSSVKLKSTKKAHHYSTDEIDQRNFAGKLAVLLSDEAIKEVYWKTEDVGDYVLHTREEFAAVCREITEYHIEYNIGKCLTLKKIIQSAEYKEELEDIKWE
ncbi:hypothetical protein M5X17_27525 [Paenibacillus alvei]|uniref:DUF4376 domain-containing protein n=1 Tax=Paenibacillus alvei TaxID=44250 RepID=UPI00227FCCF6|nr:hypothetical protein [Paenibacillus alvei]MCY9737456.1 hypothetical protein [Paenibacillus alvei]